MVLRTQPHPGGDAGPGRHRRHGGRGARPAHRPRRRLDEPGGRGGLPHDLRPPHPGHVLGGPVAPSACTRGRPCPRGRPHQPYGRVGA
ncbi:hypothetical protein GCO27_08995 [Corynebacterium sp. zg331]|nr:hypothetical protein [Corynebacterium sp. zg331]